MSEDSFSEDDDYLLLRKALDVELPENFDPNTVPQTGEEYLHHVMYERKQCKTWVTADLDLSKFEKKQTFKIQPDSTVETPSRFLPTLDWQTSRIEDFVKLRRFIASKTDDQESTVDTINEAEILQLINEKSPDFHEIIQYTQYGKMKILQLIVRLLEKNTNNQQTIERSLGSWIYAILLLLEIPLSPDFCFILREFAKKCRHLRANLHEANYCKAQLSPLNLFICIIAKFYNQLDLGDCVE